MDKEIKDKWIAALRSGKYEQGTFKLRSLDDKYCCLGVLCDVLGLQWQARDNPAYNGLSVIVPTGQVGYGSLGEEVPITTNHNALLPIEFVESIGLDEEAQVNLTNKNDYDRCTFQQIADYIEDDL